jgi:lipoyl(octanoyl) transferase
VDRGGQVTYHGPGQLVVYVLLDLRRAQLGVRQLVTLLEQSVIELLAQYGVVAHARPEAPGVYVRQAKIASLGLRVRRGCSYHGLSLNRDMDLEPFNRIDPCGYPGLRVTQLRELGISAESQEVQESLLPILSRRLGYTTLQTATTLPPLPPLETGHA